MKVFLKGYTKNNLGDDLFYKIILERYSSNIKFYTVYNKKNISLKKFKNLKMINNRVTSKLERSLGLKDFYTRYYEKKSDITLKIGGSLFIERKNILNQLSKREVIHDEYIIGSNFGPFKSEQFYRYFKDDYFPKIKDIYFREMYSYNLFKNLNNVRCGNDVVFSLDISNVRITKRKRVVFSVINAFNKFDKETSLKYFDEIIKMITKFDDLGFEIILMSFCKFEGDEDAISFIEKQMNKKINKYLYRGNIEEALDVIGDSQIVVGTRFHANILGFLMKKIVIPIAYSDKTLNVLSDLKFNGRVYDIRDDERFDIENLSSIFSENLLDLSEIIKKKDEPFKVLDTILERK